MKMYEDLKKLENENEEQYLWKVGQLIDAKKYKDWSSVNDIVNEQLGIDEDKWRDESSFRKRYQAAKKFYENCFSQMEDEEYLQGVKEVQYELEMAAIKLRDERNAFKKQKVIGARVEQKLDFLEKQMLQQGRQIFETHNHTNVKSDNDMLIILSDFHIGQCFYSTWGCYDSDVAKERLAQLLNEVKAIQKTHNSENCYVSLQGDMLSGNIHKTIQVTNRENVIEQIKIATELISSFCYELTKVFGKVYLSSVVGNHSRIDRKEDALHDERLDDVITWGVKLSLQHIDNFYPLDNNIDSGIAIMDIRDKTYIAVHGDYDKYSESGVSKLCMHLGFFPYAITYGHLHTCAIDEANGVKMIRGGSLAGSGDNYTVEKRLKGKASQMVCICNKNGVCCYYPIILD